MPIRMMEQQGYYFKHVKICNMCGATDFQVLGKRLNQHQGKNPQKKVGITTTVVRCKSCGLIFANPTPIPMHISDHYDIEVDDYFEAGFKAPEEGFFQQELEYFKSNYQKTTAFKGLDIGAGLGGIMRAMEKGGVEAYGLEPSKSFYDFAIQKGISKERLLNSSLEDASFSQETFDLVVFSAVLEHLYDPNTALANALRWLKPGGIIYIGVPSNRIFVQVLANLFYKLKGLDYVSNISPMHSPFHLYEFGLESFQRNSTINNYSILHHEFWTVNDYLFSKPNPILRSIIKLTRTEMNLTIWLRKNQTQFLKAMPGRRVTQFWYWDTIQKEMAVVGNFFGMLLQLKRKMEEPSFK